MQSSKEYIILPDLDKKIDEAIHDAINFFEKKCPYCLEPLYSGHIRNKIHLDHFIPIVKGGQHVPWNILPVCQNCNSKKHAKKPRLFLSSETYNKCELYLKSIGERHIGEVQISLEKFAQVKSILTEYNLKSNSRNKHIEILDLLCQIVLDLKPQNIDLNIQHLNLVNVDLSNLINKYFKIPEYNDKIVKLSITEIKDILSRQINKEINRTQLSRKLKELGFYSRVERTTHKTKRCFTLGLRLN